MDSVLKPLLVQLHTPAVRPNKGVPFYPLYAHPLPPGFGYHLENHTHRCNMPSGHILMGLFYVSSLVPDYCLKCRTNFYTVWWQSCLVPRPHYYAQPMHFGSSGPRKFSRPFVSDTSPKCIDPEGLERRRTGTRQVAENRSLPQCMWDTLNLPNKLTCILSLFCFLKLQKNSDTLTIMLTHETINLIRLMVSISCLYAMCRELVNELVELVMQFKQFEALLKDRERAYICMRNFY